MNSGSLRLISGVGRKGPACFLLEASGKRLLLDLGEGPPPGCLPDIEGLGAGRRGRPEPWPQGPCGRPCRRLWALAKTRQSAGLCHRARRAGLAENHCRAAAAGRRPNGRARHRRRDRAQRPRTGRDLAALRRRAAASSTPATTARSSVLYDYDPPAKAAATALIDCSYGDYQKSLARLLEHACAIPRARPAPSPSAGQWPRPGDCA